MAPLPAFQGVPGVPVPPIETGGGPNLLGAFAHHLLQNSRFDPNAHVGGPAEQSPGQYLGALAHSFNPTTPSGLFNLATTLVPGGRGRGGLTPLQQMYLEQLKTHEMVPTGGGPAYMQKVPATEGYLHPEDVAASPELQTIANHLGHTYGTPLPELLRNSARHMPDTWPYEGSTAVDVARSILGLDVLSERTGTPFERQTIGGPYPVPRYKGETQPIGASNLAHHQKLLQQILAKNAINRRN